MECIGVVGEGFLRREKKDRWNAGRKEKRGACKSVCGFFMGWGGKVHFHCLVSCCPGNKVGSSMGEQCSVAHQWNLCVCVDSGWEAAGD